jgi:carboxymethylenebutenolidase
MAVKSRNLSGPELYGYVSEPEAKARAGVLLLPTIFGVNEFARRYADILAGAGLATAVWDINSGLPLTTDYDECIRRARTLTDAKVVGMVTRWLDTMTGDMGLTSVAVLGFCIGGRFALLQAARDNRLRGCAMAYPSIENRKLPNQEMDALSLAGNIDCPALCLQPGNDHVTESGIYKRLTQELNQRTASTVMHRYPRAEHGFMHRPTPPANVEATAHASPQVMAFLQACLA